MMSDRTATERQRKRGLHTGSKRWRIIRNQVLAWEPMCRYCGDIATQVDHLDNDSHNNDIDNLAATCAPCHSRKSAMEQAGRQWRPKGCGVDGWPLDPSHRWSTENDSRLKNRQQPTNQGTPPKSPFNAKAK